MSSAANDQAVNTRNATHSVTLAAVAGEFVVSCFPVVDGVVNTDVEIIFETFTDCAIASRFYASKASLLACKAADFDGEIDHVYRLRASLSSCLHREVPTEARSLRAAIADLELCTLVRRNVEREARKARALDAARETLAKCEAGLADKIAREAVLRAAAGQP